MHRLAGGHDPRAFAADAVGDRLFFSDAELSQIRDSSSWATPLFPVARPETTTDPLVQLVGGPGWNNRGAQHKKRGVDIKRMLVRFLLDVLCFLLDVVCEFLVLRTPLLQSGATRELRPLACASCLPAASPSHRVELISAAAECFCLPRHRAKYWRQPARYPSS